ncbi:MAG TPA: 6-phosphogluconolactonase [Planctomycetota bacterium]|nr:6-phosphogluconolactonase [Planctomycetota bacterium]
MLTGTQLVFDDPAAAARAAAEAFLLALKKHDAGRRGLFNVALSGGSTPNAMYEYLAQLPVEREVRALARKARFFWSDERTVPADHAESNFGAAWTRWLKGLDLPPEQIHRLAGEHVAALSAQNYERLIEAFVPAGTGVRAGGGGVPRFDLIFLGMGPDGHTASLFPSTAALAETERLVVANAVPQQATTRLTFTFPLINAAEQVWILCTGASKAAALAAVAKAGREGNGAYPISFVQPKAKKAVKWWLDRAAVVGGSAKS